MLPAAAVPRSPLNRLIVNADDFGLTRGVNRAVGRLYDAGVLTSATLMAGGAAFDDAADTALARPGLGVGCHIVLLDGAPLAPPERVPSLLAPGSRSFRHSFVDFATALLRGQITPEDILVEATLQVRRLQQAGLRVTHLDTHKHTHMLPAVTRVLLQVAEQEGVPALRNPFEPAWAAKAAPSGSHLRQAVVWALRGLERSFLAQPAIAASRVLTTGGTLGISATGDLTASSLRQLLHALPPAGGTWELVTHPGHNDADLDRVTTRLRQTREVEMQALLDVLLPGAGSSAGPVTSSSTLAPPTLIHYAELQGTAL